MKRLRYCKRCGCKVLRETTKGLRKEYPFFCPTCDQNMYRIETFKKPRRIKKYEGNITLYLEYINPKKVNGWGGKRDFVTFDSVQDLNAYVNGDVAYDYLDNAVQTNADEILLYAADETGRVVWKNKDK